MKRILLLTLILISPCLCSLHRSGMEWIELPEPDNYYEPLMYAVMMTESSGNIYAYNYDERACGPFQIRPIRIEHFNRLTGKNYHTWDVFDLTVSREIFMYFTKGRDYETVAREWNGRGRMTIDYWKRVKKYL